MKTQGSQRAIGTSGRTGIDWRILVVWTGMALAGALLVFTALIGAIIPPLIVFAVLYGVAVWLTRRGGRGGTIMSIVLSVLLAAVTPASAEDWSRFRGRNGTGIAPDAGVGDAGR